MRTPDYKSQRFHDGRGEPFNILVSFRKLFRVLWVCRASTASALVGVGFAFLTQVHDLFLDVAGVRAPSLLGDPLNDLWPLVRDGFVLGLLTTVFWALPVHAAARLSVSDVSWLDSPYRPTSAQNLDGAAGRFDFIARWIPRLLGLVCYAALIGAAIYAWEALPIEPGTPLAQRVHNEIVADIAGLGAFALLYLIYAVFRRYFYKRMQSRPRTPPPRIGVQDGGTIGRAFDQTVALAVFLALLAILAYPPLLDWFPRLWLVPLLLGVWTPLLSLIARAGYWTRLPLGLAALCAYVFALYYRGDNHDTDLIQQPPAARPSFAEAAKRWKTLNCNGDDDCPSPIVALVSGGASRSAYFADSVLGLMTDASCGAPGAPPAACGAEPMFARRLFAISSVSGGSVGAAVYARALIDGRVAGGYSPPCKPSRDSALRFREDPTLDWRGCLQSILAEDFLSPVIAGLGFRDVFSFVTDPVRKDYLPDRGRRIERAIACAYNRYVGDKTACPDASEKQGLDAPLSSFAAANPDWSPLLLLNSTSEESGKRFVFSGLAPWAKEGGRWTMDAYDFHETSPGVDISLVAAAHNSARFPVISPAGALHNAEGKIATKLVDGGYFDNYGASTAFDLVLALKGVGLDPFVLLIANDPTLQDSAGWATGLSDGRPDLGAVKPSWIPPLIAAPLGATLATREARGEGALTELQRVLSNSNTVQKPGPRACVTTASDKDAARCFAFVSVRKPEPAPGTPAESVRKRIEGVSMSWWLSKPVQKYLDNQLELPLPTDAAESAQRVMSVTAQRLNRQALDRVCDTLADETATPRCRGTLAGLAH